MFRFNKFTSKFVLFLLILGIIYPPQAHAYLDPNTGSMIIQAIIAGLATLGFTFNLWKDKVISFFKKEKGKNKNEN